jgi:hypothetical protein
MKQRECEGCTALWVVEGHLPTMCHQPLVSSPAGVSKQRVRTKYVTFDRWRAVLQE